MKIIAITIDSDDTECGECSLLERRSTGLAGEWWMHCILFDESGPWRKENMKRRKACIKAEKFRRDHWDWHDSNDGNPEGQMTSNDLIRGASHETK